MTDDTVTATLAKWEALVEGATEGPWEAFGTTVGANVGPGDCGGCSGLPSPRHEPACYWDEVASAAFADAEFIAAARHIVPALLGFVREVLTLIDEDHCPGGCEHDAIDAEVLGDRIKRTLAERVGGEG